MTTHKIYIPRDSSALSLGAEEVFKAIKVEASNRKIEIEIIRNGSRGLFWLETMVEVKPLKEELHTDPLILAMYLQCLMKNFS